MAPVLLSSNQSAAISKLNKVREGQQRPTGKVSVQGRHRAPSAGTQQPKGNVFWAGDIGRDAQYWGRGDQKKAERERETETEVTFAFL